VLLELQVVCVKRFPSLALFSMSEICLPGNVDGSFFLPGKWQLLNLCVVLRISSLPGQQYATFRLERVFVRCYPADEC